MDKSTLIKCKGCNEWAEERDYNPEVGLCIYCEDFMEEIENESRNRTDSGRRETEESYK